MRGGGGGYGLPKGGRGAEVFWGEVGRSSAAMNAMYAHFGGF